MIIKPTHKHKRRYFLYKGRPAPIVQGILIPAKGSSNLPDWWRSDLALEYSKDGTFVTIYHDDPRQRLTLPQPFEEIFDIQEPISRVGINAFVGQQLLIHFGDHEDAPLFDVVYDTVEALAFDGLQECDENGHLL